MAKKLIKVGKHLHLVTGKLTRQEMQELDERLNRAPVQMAGPRGRAAKTLDAPEEQALRNSDKPED
jgi:hypothetical protein